MKIKRIDSNPVLYKITTVKGDQGIFSMFSLKTLAEAANSGDRNKFIKALQIVKETWPEDLI